MTTTTPSDGVASSCSFKSMPPTHKQDMGLKVESGLNSGRE